MSRIQQVVDTLEAERADLQQRLAWLEEQIKEFHAHRDGAAPPPPRYRSASEHSSCNRPHPPG